MTIEARGCQRASAQQMVEPQADYVLALKGNQPTLEQAVQPFLATGPEAGAHRATADYYARQEPGQGRVETRS